jgi:hypothetical protein
MRAAYIHAGDEVLIDIRGRRFRARILGELGSNETLGPDRFPIVSLDPSAGHHAAKPRQIIRRLYRAPRRFRGQLPMPMAMATTEREERGRR